MGCTRVKEREKYKTKPTKQYETGQKALYVPESICIPFSHSEYCSMDWHICEKKSGICVNIIILNVKC